MPVQCLDGVEGIIWFKTLLIIFQKPKNVFQKALTEIGFLITFQLLKKTTPRRHVMYSHVSNFDYKTQSYGNKSVTEMFEEAGLLYKVEKRRLGYLDDDGNFIPSKVKRNHTLKVVSAATEFDGVSADWNLFQPDQLAEWTEQVVERFDLIPYAAGAFNGTKDHGQIGWFQARLPGEFQPFKGDYYDPLLTITNQLKYGTTWGGGFSNIRIWCKNSFHAADADLQIRLTHRVEFDEEVVAEQIEKIAADWGVFQKKIEFIGGKRLTSGKAIKDYFEALFPPKSEDNPGRILSKVVNAMETQPGAQVREGSWYQAFNAVTYTVDHLLLQSNPAAQARQAMIGKAELKRKALKLAVEAANKSPDLLVAA
jgi:hypothetical protein